MIPGIDVFSTTGERYGSLSSERGSIRSDVGEAAETALGLAGVVIVVRCGSVWWWLNTFEPQRHVGRQSRVPRISGQAE